MTDEIQKDDTDTGRKQVIALAVLAIYTALLALGTVGELFDIDWILDLPIFKGP